MGQVAHTPLNRTSFLGFFLSAEYLFSRTEIERAVMAAKANVDTAYQYSRQEYVH